MHKLYQKSVRKIFAIVTILLLPILCLAQSHQGWSYNLAIYEVNVRQYTAQGTFDAFGEHLDRLQDMGAGILWFMPIHPIGQQNRLGSLGSYYAVRDYLDVNPEFGTLDDFKNLVQAAHERGMYVIMDWVANHTAWDNVLTTTHPEWYVTDANGNFIAPPGTNWSDVIELDYAQPGLRDYMIEAMKFWVNEAGVDGFRCDAVSMVPTDFWQKALPALREIKPDIFLLAEDDGKPWHNAGFDMTYAWGLYGFNGGVLKRIADGTNNAASFAGYAASETRNYGHAYQMYFTSNHDENSWQGTTRELFGEAAEVFTVLTATFNGLPLVYSGQEAGLDKRLKFFDKDEIPWQEHPNAVLFSTLLHLKKENHALWNGDRGGLLQRVQTSNNTAVYAFVREKDADRVFVALNLSDQEQTVTLDGDLFAGDYQNVFSGETVTLAASASLTLPAWGYLVYDGDANTGVRDEVLPVEFGLEQNYPNPFNATTKITFSLAAPAPVKITIIDVRGRIVETLFAGEKPAGWHEITLNAEGLASGVYLYRLQAGNVRETKRMLLLR